MKRIFVAVIIVFIVAEAQAQFILSGEFRPRYEYRDGYKKMPEHGTVAANVVTQRTRLLVDWRGKRLASRITFQDVRVWGDEPMKKDIAGLGLYEGWVEIGITDSLKLKAGRQEIIYDNKRLIDIGNWGVKGVTHDALLMQYKMKGWHLEVAAAFNQTKDTIFSTDYSAGQGNYKALTLAWLSKSVGPVRLSCLLVADAYQKKKTTNTMYVRGTGGLMGALKTTHFNADIRGFYQTGQNEAGDFIQAYYGNCDLTAILSKKFSILGGFEYQSGHDSARSGAHYFTTLYGSAHAFNGSMDYFTKPSDTRNTGLIDVYLDLIGKFGKKITGRADFHYFRIANNYPDRVHGGDLDQSLALEGDISCGMNITPEISILAGYSALVGSHTLEVIAGGDNAHYAHWGFVMLTVKPVFFKWEPKS